MHTSDSPACAQTLCIPASCRASPCAPPASTSQALLTAHRMVLQLLGAQQHSHCSSTEQRACKWERGGFGPCTCCPLLCRTELRRRPQPYRRSHADHGACAQCHIQPDNRLVRCFSICTKSLGKQGPLTRAPASSACPPRSCMLCRMFAPIACCIQSHMLVFMACTQGYGAAPPPQPGDHPLWTAEVLPTPLPPQRRIYCNRGLNMAKIKVG